ncbi:FAD-dependent 5-carboxymethylaminomethyl-2-thiouridine(34) oxidoreductase MnmC [Kingella negevensis]|uniref:FAD-dependent 5-carboxymethylaminomethyl-2-thiouridine(34) oxidoreductase MnmC n=1 Tax=Kingella negevensis TaxID=1522312 RepID=UPI00254D7CC7|nr:FAD-dependent 5-carboxymethylaminomethyl-2-thiouridine(34) oxidoreductase MnmC [Kingella negevensis]MDK4683902.1 FAD-dependent 5-carboxymethylaminomethyl-2-thiouridine(34) oxidoreductase MnmC [Kingella negevensis]MDK4706987.1 FAD-dependent 5-carboxymethylaminomethyl-2-thiouridine(34) oxidoreductase MnmC [Kingella negevensis]MDK4710567.1 FAD-dependent 5-carboxymethylaminomethyl-2-thiouridine(34) oxidoreductase MnmC [Kingella negevensis]
MTPIYAWATLPEFAEIQSFLTEHNHPKHLIFCLQNTDFPHFTQPENSTAEQTQLHTALTESTRCLTFDAVNYIANWQPQTHLWFMPVAAASALHEHFTQPENIIWQTQAIPQNTPKSQKSWQTQPENPHTQPENIHAVIIGAGIAGAATAHELAIHGAKVTVLERSERVAQAGSGNQQGLLYAKISPHNTEQTELLLTGYGYTRRILKTLFPNQENWGATGILHLNHNESETQRNQKLAQKTHYRHLYRPVTPEEASQIAGIPIAQSGLYWQQGAWLNPPAIVNALLQHPNITVHTQTQVHTATHNDAHWQIQTNQGDYTATHLIICTGADNQTTPIIRDYPFQMIRGQTSVATATEGSLKLKTALSGASYISPAWHNQHCFGATFINNDPSSEWRGEDDTANQQELAQLNPFLASELHTQPENINHGSLKGHTAVRCNSHDHLPVVGALSDVAAMRSVYAKLALDKNYRLTAPCPYLPNAYTNTAHGSRGLATAPICAAEIAAQICGTPHPLSERLRQALNPNRLIIRQIVRHEVQ